MLGQASKLGWLHSRQPQQSGSIDRQISMHFALGRSYLATTKSICGQRGPAKNRLFTYYGCALHEFNPKAYFDFPSAAWFHLCRMLICGDKMSNKPSQRQRLHDGQLALGALELVYPNPPQQRGNVARGSGTVAIQADDTVCIEGSDVQLTDEWGRAFYLRRKMLFIKGSMRWSRRTHT
jgi:hypothetical protein